MPEVRTENDFLYSIDGTPSLVPLFPPIISTKQQAYRTASWLIIMALLLPDENVPSTFDEVMLAMQNT